MNIFLTYNISSGRRKIDLLDCTALERARSECALIFLSELFSPEEELIESSESFLETDGEAELGDAPEPEEASFALGGELFAPFSLENRPPNTLLGSISQIQS